MPSKIRVDGLRFVTILFRTQAPRRDDAHSFTRDARVKLSEDDGSLLSAWSPDSQTRPAGRRSLVSQPSTLSVRSRCSTPVERRRQATREATNPQRLRAANAKLKKRQAARDVLYLYERRDAVSLRLDASSLTRLTAGASRCPSRSPASTATTGR